MLLNQIIGYVMTYADMHHKGYHTGSYEKVLGLWNKELVLLQVFMIIEIVFEYNFSAFCNS